MKIINSIRSYIREVTNNIPDSDYIVIMRDLSAWANEQAEIAEYEPDVDCEDEEY